MGARKLRELLRWAGTLVFVVPLVVMVSGCGQSDSHDASEGSGGTAGTGPSGGTGGTGGTETQECRDFQAAPTLQAACLFVVPDCPATLDEFLTYVTEFGVFSLYSVVEADGLREVRNVSSYSGRAFSFDEGGMLAGWETWGDTLWGPCNMGGYQQGRILGDYHETPANVHRCELARDALETGILCDCPCPEPPPENAIYEAPEACLSVGAGTPGGASPDCASSFADQRNHALSRGATMRTGCGVRTITLDDPFPSLPLDCAYDDAGMLLGGERHRGDDPRDECPGVDVFRTGAPPVDCADEIICYFGPMPPAGSTPCL